jgi:AbrB family looped-hinge helix DNA binding protein
MKYTNVWIIQMDQNGFENCHLPYYNGNIQLEGFMEVSVDKFGRVVIPKLIRQHLGLTAGSILQVIEHENNITLKISEDEPLLQHQEGIMVFTGKAVGDITSAIKTTRDERLEDMS